MSIPKISLLAARLAALLLCAAAARAQEAGWRGIVPLRSTRADVERLLGPPRGDCKCLYDAAGAFVHVNYAQAPCKGYPSGWNVPEDTVLMLTVREEGRPPLSELKLDDGRYKTAYDDALFTYYSSRAEGVQYVVSNEREVRSVAYFPRASDAGLRCRCFPEEDESVFRTPPFYDFAPRSLVTMDARLDNFAADAQNDPRAKVYAIVYEGRSARAAARYRAGVRDWLVNVRGIEAGRVFVTGGGLRERLEVELFLFPPSLAPPDPRPTRAPCAPRRRRAYLIYPRASNRFLAHAHKLVQRK